MINLERQKKAHGLFKRFAGNPILTTHDWPYPVNAVFNAGAIKIDSETLLLVRCEDMRGFSHLTVARSADGFTNWKIDPTPTFEAEYESHEERFGVEDPHNLARRAEAIRNNIYLIWRGRACCFTRYHQKFQDICA